MKNNYNFIAIGDTTTDAFINLKEGGAAHLDIDKGAKELCLRFADKIPYEEVYVIPAVGNAANASVAAARLGLKSALVSNIGDDYFGKECLNALLAEKVGTDFVKIHQGIKTNYHYVLWYEDDRTILIKHEHFPYSLPDINEPRWVYFSSLGGNSEEFHKTVENYLIAHPNIKLSFQPGPKIVVVTGGPAGAYASSGTDAYFMPPYPDPKPPFERTGAGDAFSSTLAVYLAKGMSLADSLKRAPINSMSVVQYIGAREGLLSAAQIEDYIKKAPSDYKPKKI